MVYSVGWGSASPRDAIVGMLPVNAKYLNMYALLAMAG